MPVWVPKQKPAIDWVQSISRGLISRSLTDSIRAAELVDGGLLTYYDVGGSGVDAKFRGTAEGGALWFNENNTRVAGAIVLEHLGEDPFYEAEDLAIHVRVKGNDSTQVSNEDNLFGQWGQLQGQNTTGSINLRWDSNNEQFELEWRSGDTSRAESATLSGFGHTQFCERFHDIVLTFTTMTPRLYVDGVLVKTFTQHTPGIRTGYSSVSTYLEILGGHKTTGPTTVDAPRVDCLGYGVWNRGLTAGEVAQITEQGRYYGLSSAANDPNVVFTQSSAAATAPVWLPPYTDVARALSGWHPGGKQRPKVEGPFQVRQDGLWRGLIFAADYDREFISGKPALPSPSMTSSQNRVFDPEYGITLDDPDVTHSGLRYECTDAGFAKRLSGTQHTIITFRKIDGIDQYGMLLCIPHDYDAVWNAPYGQVLFNRNISSDSGSFSKAMGGTTRSDTQSDAGYLDLAGPMRCYGVTHNVNTVRFYRDGQQYGGAKSISGGGVYDRGAGIAPVHVNSRNHLIGGEQTGGLIGLSFIFNRALSADEMAEVYRNPWGFLAPASNDPSVVFTQSGGGEPSTDRTGSISVTLDDITADLNGTHTAPASRSGAIAIALDGITADLDGTVTAPGANTGAIAVSLDDIAADLNGTHTAPAARSGAIAISLDDITSDLNGTHVSPQDRSGAIAVTLDGITADLNGTFTQADVKVGTINVTLDQIAPDLNGVITSPENRSGNISVSLDAIAADLNGTAAGPGVKVGVISATLDAIAADINGTVVNPPAADRSGAIAVTLADIAADLNGTSSGVVAPGAGLTPEQDAMLKDVHAKLNEMWRIMGLDSANPMTDTPTSRTAGDISIQVTGDGVTTSTAQRL